MDRNAIEVTFGGITLRHREGSGDDGTVIWHGDKGDLAFQIVLFLRGTGAGGVDCSGKWAVNVYDAAGGRLEGMTLLDSPDSAAEAMFSKY